MTNQDLYALLEEFGAKNRLIGMLRSNTDQESLDDVHKYRGDRHAIMTSILDAFRALKLELSEAEDDARYADKRIAWQHAVARGDTTDSLYDWSADEPTQNESVQDFIDRHERLHALRNTTTLKGDI